MATAFPADSESIVGPVSGYEERTPSQLPSGPQGCLKASTHIEGGDDTHPSPREADLEVDEDEGGVKFHSYYYSP